MFYSQVPVLRRSRGAVDGPWSLFALVQKHKVPLEDDQAEHVLAAVREAGTWSDARIVEFLESYLACEEGTSVDGHVLMGFLREPEPWSGSLEPSLTEIPDACDLCGRDLRNSGYAIDGITTRGYRWSFLCVPCFFREGCGLGIGWGQLYKRGSDGDWLLVKGQPAADDE